jgi:hypothetical protein
MGRYIFRDPFGVGQLPHKQAKVPEAWTMSFFVIHKIGEVVYKGKYLTRPHQQSKVRHRYDDL